MKDRFLVPYYFFWPIILISFILVFFLPTSSKIKFKNIKYSYNNETNSYSFFNKNNDNITDNLSINCKSLIINIKNQEEIKYIKKINLAIKIIIFILFGLTILNVLCVILMIKVGLCYDEDYGGFCQTWEDIFSLSHFDDEKIEIKIIFIYLFFIIILFGIIFLSCFSLNFSKKFKNKMENCNFYLGKDYNYKFFNVSSVFLIIIIILLLLEIIFTVYSIFFAIFLIMKMDKNNNKGEKKVRTEETQIETK